MDEVHPIDNYVEVEIRGKKYRLTYGFRAGVEFERLSGGQKVGRVFAGLVPEVGETTTQSLRRVLRNFSATEVSRLIYCMLLENHRKEVTLDSVIDMIDAKNFGEIWMQVQELLTGSADEPEEGQAPVPLPQGQPNG